ncbi:hypothetical protein [Flammeovirga sp. EKP202]|uniref:hypothetical protein n=1 Tax=Flammeovirga sp. EKP202 TaxID=2770592 RepID=UPI00165F0964|nr:hypothetical protein [Flammeovirga sp. EKP202]MBD0403508.1 hypothetical protein [Flammeovirga sp. EKP202]
MKYLNVLSLFLFLFSCSTTNEETVVDAEAYNKSLQQSFELTAPLDSKSGMEAFFAHFKSQKIVLDGEMRSITQEELTLLYDLTLEKIALFATPSNAKKAPTREQIRDAMRAECGGYMLGLDWWCKAAVDIAYLLG